VADGFTIDTTELNRLAVDLGKAPTKALGPIEQVIKRGALNLKDAMADRFKGHLAATAAARPTGDRIARAVSADRIGFAQSFGYEVGPTLGGAGSLASVAVEGGADGGGGTVQIDDLLPAEAEQVEKFIGEALEGLL
jgi:hypothetical protein